MTLFATFEVVVLAFGTLPPTIRKGKSVGIQWSLETFITNTLLSIETIDWFLLWVLLILLILRYLNIFMRKLCVNKMRVKFVMTWGHLVNGKLRKDRIMLLIRLLLCLRWAINLLKLVLLFKETLWKDGTEFICLRSQHIVLIFWSAIAFFFKNLELTNMHLSGRELLIVDARRGWACISIIEAHLIAAGVVLSCHYFLTWVIPNLIGMEHVKSHLLCCILWRFFILSWKEIRG